MRKQYHFWKPDSGDGLDAWDVDRLIELSADLPVFDLALDDIAEIDSAYWFDDETQPTVRLVAMHAQLIAEVDPSHPIIVGPDGRVMDGMHRIARALLEGRPCVAARRLTELPAPHHRNVRPEELNYDR